MKEIQQVCPRCSATLAVPEDSVGSQARCPSCNHLFVITASETPAPAPLYAPESTAPAHSTADPVLSAADTVPPPNDRRTNPDLENPYAPKGTTTHSPQRASQPFIATTVVADQYISATIYLFQQSWQPLVGVGAILLVINILNQVLSQVLSMAFQESGQWVFMLVNIVIQVLLSLAYLYVMIGLKQMGFDLARGRPIRFSQGFEVPPILFGQTILGYLVLGIPFLLLAAPFALLVLGVDVPEALAWVAFLGGGFIALAAMTLMYLFLWPWQYLLIDRRLSLREAFQKAYEIASINKVNAFLLLLLGMGLGTAGMCMCCIGQAATLPATVLLICTAVLQMSGQATVQPPAAAPMISPLDNPQPGAMNA
ncbi:hypothetical protein FF011L_10310 [Roseimaritima multifibrata]|uniref:Zinc finger/thioredoxin putative domain-containing protein n=1 Tax=Roseimaritima multifibrata TaxID=1930274 RepID=A0A517MBL7_9BACT|nr:hypothetical protein [Roseimaritima multifibrata]QDS92289.1 hypothetical protein FF011L_10310 [Roseimaritima multifibrata]